MSTPTPILSYDFSNYVANASTLTPSVGSTSLQVASPSSNTFSSAAPNPNLTLLLGSLLYTPLPISNVRTIELWYVRKVSSISTTNQTLVDITSPADNSTVLYTIRTNGATSQTNTNMVDSVFYKDTIENTITSTTNFMNYDSGDVITFGQTVIVLNSKTAGYLGFFGNSTGTGGNWNGVSVSEIHVYSSALTATQVNLLYNMRGPSRYGLTESDRRVTRPPNFVYRPLIPIAEYDFNGYTNLGGTIFNSREVTNGLVANATITAPLNNVFTSDSVNSFLTLAPLQAGVSGSITTPALSGIQTIELWIRQEGAPLDGAVFMDFTSSNLAYSAIQYDSIANDIVMGNGFNNIEMYNNSVKSITHLRTSIYEELWDVPNSTSKGWRQLVFVLREPVFGTLCFFANRSTFFMGCRLSVANIALYNYRLTSREVVKLYDTKRARYLLPAMPYLQMDTTFQNSSVYIEKKNAWFGCVLFRGSITSTQTYTSSASNIVAFGNTDSWATTFNREYYNNLVAVTSGLGSLFRGTFVARIPGFYIIQALVRLQDNDTSVFELAPYLFSPDGIREKHDKRITRIIFSSTSGRRAMPIQSLVYMEAGASFFFANTSSVSVPIVSYSMGGVYLGPV